MSYLVGYTKLTEDSLNETLDKACLIRVGTTTLQLVGFEGSTKIWIQDRLVTLPLSINSQTSHCIDSTGDTTGVAPLASTKYWVYAQNGTLGLGNLACCLTPPAALPYLGSSGNATKWRLVGNVSFDGSVEIAEDWHVGSYYCRSIDEALAVVTLASPASGTNVTAYTYTDFMLMPNMEIFIEFRCNLLKLGGISNMLVGLKMFIDTVEKIGKIMYIDDTYGDCIVKHKLTSTSSYATIPSIALTELKVWCVSTPTSIGFPVNRNSWSLNRKRI